MSISSAAMRRRHGEKAREPQLARERAADEVVTAGEVDQRHCVNPVRTAPDGPVIMQIWSPNRRICRHFCMITISAE